MWLHSTAPSSIVLNWQAQNKHSLKMLMAKVRYKPVCVCKQKISPPEWSIWNIMRNCFFMTYFSIATQFQWFQLKYIQPWSIYGQCNQPYHCNSHFILPNELKRGIWFQLTHKWIVTVRFFFVLFRKSTIRLHFHWNFVHWINSWKNSYKPFHDGTFLLKTNYILSSVSTLQWCNWVI